MNQQTKGLAWLILAILAGTLWAVGLPFLARLIPWSLEKHAAAYTMDGSISVCTNPSNPQAFVLFKTITQRLFPLYSTDSKLPITIEAIHGDTVNAYAGLGGHIYVYDGLIKQAESADELAGVLAHEIEHVRRRHIMEGILVQLSTVEALELIFSGGAHGGPEIARMFLNLRFNRDQEAEADEGGLKRLKDTHIDSRGYVHFFERLKGLSSTMAILSDHPAHADRAEMARKIKTASPQPILTSAEWAKVQTICH
jgi:predicted Zn-dependent protease